MSYTQAGRRFYAESRSSILLPGAWPLISLPAWQEPGQVAGVCVLRVSALCYSRAVAAVTCSVKLGLRRQCYVFKELRRQMARLGLRFSLQG